MATIMTDEEKRQDLLEFLSLFTYAELRSAIVYGIQIYKIKENVVYGQ